jgi:hypothetical protein
MEKKGDIAHKRQERETTGHLNRNGLTAGIFLGACVLNDQLDSRACVNRKSVKTIGGLPITIYRAINSRLDSKLEEVSTHAFLKFFYIQFQSNKHELFTLQWFTSQIAYLLSDSISILYNQSEDNGFGARSPCRKRN